MKLSFIRVYHVFHLFYLFSFLDASKSIQISGFKERVEVNNKTLNEFKESSLTTKTSSHTSLASASKSSEKLSYNSSSKNFDRLKRASYYSRSDLTNQGSGSNGPGGSGGGSGGSGFRGSGGGPGSDSLNNNGAHPRCPNITRNSRYRCAQNLEEQACNCYVKAYGRWLNNTVSVSAEKASCCSRLEVKNCVERLLRTEKRDCKSRWEKEAKRYADLVIQNREYSCRDYRKQEYCKLESINFTLIILLITIALLAIVACLGFTGYACYRRYNE